MQAYLNHHLVHGVVVQKVNRIDLIFPSVLSALSGTKKVI